MQEETPDSPSPVLSIVLDIDTAAYDTGVSQQAWSAISASPPEPASPARQTQLEQEKQSVDHQDVPLRQSELSAQEEGTSVAHESPRIEHSPELDGQQGQVDPFEVQQRQEASPTFETQRDNVPGGLSLSLPFETDAQDVELDLLEQNLAMLKMEQSRYENDVEPSNLSVEEEISMLETKLLSLELQAQAELEAAQAELLAQEAIDLFTLPTVPPVSDKMLTTLHHLGAASRMELENFHAVTGDLTAEKLAVPLPTDIAVSLTQLQAYLQTYNRQQLVNASQPMGSNPKLSEPPYEKKFPLSGNPIFEAYMIEAAYQFHRAVGAIQGVPSSEAGAEFDGADAPPNAGSSEPPTPSGATAAVATSAAAATAAAARGAAAGGAAPVLARAQGAPPGAVGGVGGVGGIEDANAQLPAAQGLQRFLDVSLMLRLLVFVLLFSQMHSGVSESRMTMIILSALLVYAWRVGIVEMLFRRLYPNRGNQQNQAVQVVTPLGDFTRVIGLAKGWFVVDLLIIPYTFILSLLPRWDLKRELAPLQNEQRNE